MKHYIRTKNNIHLDDKLPLIIMDIIEFNENEINDIITTFLSTIRCETSNRNRLETLPNDILSIIWRKVFNDSIELIPLKTKWFYEEKVRKADWRYRETKRQSTQYNYGLNRIKTQKGRDRWEIKMDDLSYKERLARVNYQDIKEFYIDELRHIK